VLGAVTATPSSAAQDDDAVQDDAMISIAIDGVEIRALSLSAVDDEGQAPTHLT